MVNRLFYWFGQQRANSGIQNAPGKRQSLDEDSFQLESLEARMLLSASLESGRTTTPDSIATNNLPAVQFADELPARSVLAYQGDWAGAAQLVNRTFILTSDAPMWVPDASNPSNYVNIGTKAHVLLGPAYDEGSGTNQYSILTPDGVVRESGTWEGTFGKGSASLTLTDRGIGSQWANVTINFDNENSGTYTTVNPQQPSVANGGTFTATTSSGGAALNQILDHTFIVTSDAPMWIPDPSDPSTLIAIGTQAHILFGPSYQPGSGNNQYTIVTPDGVVRESGTWEGSFGNNVADIALSIPGFDKPWSVSVVDFNTQSTGTYTSVPSNMYGPSYIPGYGTFVSVENPMIFGSVTHQAIVASTGSGTSAQVRVLNASSNVVQAYYPFGGFSNGITVACGDVNGDGTPDVIAAAGPGGASNIRVLDGNTGTSISGPLGSCLAYPGVGGDPAVATSAFYTLAFQGRINVAAGDINGDGHDDIIVSIAADGPPHLKVFSGADGSELMSMLVYPGASDPADPAYFGNAFQGGVRVASGDVTGDGRDDIITGAGPGAGPHVKVFDGVTQQAVKSYFAYDPAYSGGVRVAAGDYDGDGKADIITSAGIGAGPHVKAIDAASGNELASFYAYDPGFLSGIWIASADLDGDGKAEILAIPGAGGGPNVKVFQGGGGYAPNAISSFFAFDQDYVGGSRIAAPVG